ncbi:VWA domain-containing protein [Candidatus Parvarchaeota archaeon]|nr:VWA domain-containing protein [Candidatus Parvarchaeota archaeon]
MMSEKELISDFEQIRHSMHYPRISKISDSPGLMDCRVIQDAASGLLELAIDLAEFERIGGREHVRKIIAHELAHLEVCPRNYPELLEIESGTLAVEPDHALAQELAHVLSDTIVNNYIASKGFDVTLAPSGLLSPKNWVDVPAQDKPLAMFIGHLHFLCAGRPSPYSSIASLSLLQDAKKYFDIATNPTLKLFNKSYECAKIIRSYSPKAQGSKSGAAKGAFEKARALIGLGFLGPKEKKLPEKFRQVRYMLGGKPQGKTFESLPVQEEYNPASVQDKRQALAAYLAGLDPENRRLLSRSLEQSTKTAIPEFELLKAQAMQQLDFHLHATSESYGGMVSPLHFKSWDLGDDPQALDVCESLVEGAGEILPNFKTVQLVKKRGHGQPIEKAPLTLLLVDTSGSMGKTLSCVAAFALIEAHRIQSGKIGIVGFTTDVWLNCPPTEDYSGLEQSFYSNYSSGGTDYSSCMLLATQYKQQHIGINIILVSDMKAPSQQVTLALRQGLISLVHMGEEANARELAQITRGVVVHAKSQEHLSRALLQLHEYQKE